MENKTVSQQKMLQNKKFAGPISILIFAKPGVKYGYLHLNNAVIPNAKITFPEHLKIIFFRMVRKQVGVLLKRKQINKSTIKH